MTEPCYSAQVLSTSRDSLSPLDVTIRVRLVNVGRFTAVYGVFPNP